MSSREFLQMSMGPGRAVCALGGHAKVAVLTGLCVGLGLAQLFAQSNVGSMVGTITDPSGAVIVGATVTLTNPATGVKQTTKTTSIGEYVFYDLPPATYDLTVEYAGFKRAARAGIILQVAEKLNVSFTLEPGAETQTVEVTGQSPLLQSETSSLGTVIAENTISALPLNGRNVYELVKLAPGTVPNDRYGGGGVPAGGFFQGNGLNEISINGGRNLSTSFMLDDVDNILMGYNGVSVVPTLDSVQEFNVLTNSYSAKYGRSGGGYVTSVTKSGTNELHGDIWEFLRNDKLDANDFFANSEGKPIAPLRQNQFGGVAGGRLRRDKTFWFGSYEAFRSKQGGQNLLTVPTDAQKKGDFSQVGGTIYNPFTTTVDARGNFIRQPFTGNMITSNLFDPVAQSLLQYFPEPNLPGVVNNFISQVGTSTLNDAFMGRIDDNISDRARIFGRYNFTRHHGTQGNVFGNIADPFALTNFDRNQGATLSYTNTLNPTTVLNVRYGFVRGTISAAPPSLGFDPTKLGFPASTVSQFETKLFPRFDIAGYTSLGTQFFTITQNGATTNSLASNLSKVIGRHSLEFGTDLRLIQGFTFQPGWPAGQFTFGPGFTQGPVANNPDPSSGNGFASFLLGAQGGNFASYDPHWFFTNRYYAFYIQDDVKFSRKLTLNIGLRYDYENPLNDRHNQLSWVDLKQAIPLPAVPQVNVPGLGLLPKEPYIGGGVMFPYNKGSGPAQLPRRRDFGPNLGLAYSVTPKTVVRGGYRILYPGTTADNSGNFPTIQGYNPITSTTLAPDGFTPIQSSNRSFLLSNPYPNGLTPVQGTSLGLLTSVGNANHGIEHYIKSAYVQQWNFGLQRELPGNLLIEAAYVGSHGVHISDFNSYNFDQLPDQYLSLGNSLFNTYPNPFLGIVPANTTIGSSPTLSLQQLLSPYPEYSFVTAGPEYLASTNYEGFQLKALKRMSHGLTLLSAYTASKLLDQTSSVNGNHFGNSGYQDGYNRRLEYGVDTNDRSQVWTVSPVYQLPIGRGKALAGSVSNRFVNQFISGWEASSILSFATGFPVAVACFSGCQSPANRPNLVANPNAGIKGSNESRLNHWYNTAAFAPNPPFTYGTAPRELPATRGPGLANMDFSLIKDTRWSERYNVEFRAEFFNFLNRPTFQQPDTNGAGYFGGPSFAQITSTVGNARIIQFGLKVYF